MKYKKKIKKFKKFSILFTVHEGIKRIRFKKVHEGGKTKYKCLKCDYTSNFTNNIKTHTRRVHEGERNLKCDTCGKSFFANHGLERHIALGKGFVKFVLYSSGVFVILIFLKNCIYSS